MKKPTILQAKTALRHWLSATPLYLRTIKAANSSTWNALKEMGWIVPTNEVGSFPSGANYVVHVVTGEAALAAAKLLVADMEKRGAAK